MTPSEVERIQLELKKLKKVCDQLKIDLCGVELALPTPVGPYIDALTKDNSKDKGVSLIY